MLHRPSEPAQQLRSVSGRYAGPLVRATGRDVPPTKSGPSIADSRPDADIVEEPRSDAAHPRARDAALARLEAVLFLAREPLTSRRLSQYANLADGTQARTLVRRLNEQYDAAGRAFRVEHVAGGYQLLSRRQFGPWLRRLAHVPSETRLSAPALETLAVIAYRQPVPRADIEAIRGVSCGEILRQLMDRDLVRIGGRSDDLGRPYLYSTTRRFLQLFGLVHLEDLPRRDELRGCPLPQSPPVFPQPADEPEPEAEALAETEDDWTDDASADDAQHETTPR